MKPVSVFTFGYHGWGPWTERLVEAVDKVERARGFDLPTFVDIRIRRSVRAPGFRDDAFEHLLGASHYRWMPDLGNRQIIERRGTKVRIARPEAAYELLGMALAAGEERRRLIVFCHCPFPRDEGKIACHRTTVGTLLLRAARKLNVPLQVVEWPGGRPKHLRIKVEPDQLKEITKARQVIPAGKFPLATLAGLPWCSVVSYWIASGETVHRVTGPACWQKGKGWRLPVMGWFDDPEATLEQYQTWVRTLRKGWGFAARSSQVGGG
jgi:hypothetical protein